MKRWFGFFFSLLFFILAGDSYGHFTAKGHIHTLSERKQIFSNPDCRSTDTCDLKKFALTTSVYEVWFSDDPKYPTYGNGAIMEYETDSVEALEKYAIVQFKRGCVFYSSKNGAGTIDRHVSDTVKSFGEMTPFCFPNWVIDSHDDDPVYNSDPQYGRFYLLRWNKPRSYDHQTQKYYGAEKPRIPLVYMADYPSGAFVTETRVKNTALEFNTCIFKASDVPLQTRRDDIEFARPITCFEWQNVYVYDFDQGRFQTSWVDVPWRERPSMGTKTDVLVTFVTLFLALVPATTFLFLRFLKHKDRC
jgi:hypothetical protein